MVAAWRRAVAVAGLALCALLVSGCHAQGTFDVLSEERVALDVMVIGDDVNCPNAVDALKLTVATVRDASGKPACHVTGETQATYFSPFGINISRAAEYLVFQANLSGGSVLPTSDIQIRFPGPVVSAGRGVVVGNTVHITDLDDLTRGSGLRVVAHDRPGPPVWLVAALLGSACGVALTLLTLALVRYYQRRPGAGGPVLLTPGESVDDRTVTDRAPAPAPLVPAADGAHRTVHGIGRPIEATTATGPSATGPDSDAQPPPDPEPEQPVDHSWFAEPPPAAEAPPSPAAIEPDPWQPSAGAGEDHSFWAAPEDRR